MAKFTPGPAIAAASGSVGGTTFSRNRSGMYMRRRAIPTNPSTSYQDQIRALFAANSQAWSGLTDAQRSAWTNYARQTPVLNALGNSFTRSGHQAYCALNTRLALIGSATISTPPISNAPDALTSYTQTFDIGAGAFAATFTPTPIGANNRLFILACVINSAGISYVKNRLRYIGVSAANQATGYDAQSQLESRLGALTVGQVVHFRLHVVNDDTGLLSPGQSAFGAVVST